MASLQRKSASPRCATLFTLELSNGLYTAAWFFILAFHAVCGTYLICVAMTDWFVTKGMIMPYYVSIWSLTGIDNYRFYGFMFGVVGGMHGVRVMYLILLSIRDRRLTLRSEKSIVQSFVPERFLSSPSGSRKSSTSASPSGLKSTLAHVWNNLFSRKGLFGVESEHFSTVFTFREVMEASSQTYQAYRASNLLPGAGLNSIIVALLVTNCWSTAAIQLFLRKTPALERVVTLTYDASISFGMMVAVPLSVFVPYIEAFNVETQRFKDPEFLQDPVSMVLENRLIFASGLFDFGTKLIPQLSIMLSLTTICELLGRSDVKVIPGPGNQSIQSLAVRPKDDGMTADKLNQKNELLAASGGSNSTQRASFRAFQKWKHIIAVVVFVIWGATILLLHGLAAARAANYQVLGCISITRPWFSNGKEPCSSLVYDCNVHKTESPDENTFDKLDPVALAVLAIVHCPALEIPSDMQSFTNLITLNIYNSSIVSWDITSSISVTAHTRLLAVFVGKTNMTEFPEGLLQPLPAALMSIQFSETNLTKLPDDLYMRWHGLALIAFDNGILTEVPYQLFFSPVYTLSLMGNRLETLPQLAMMPPGMIIPELRLRDNPLRELPAALMAPTPFVMSLNVQNTSLTTMPTWVKTNTKVVWAYNTPFCAAPMADPTLAYQVMCFDRLEGKESYFPTERFEKLYGWSES